MGNKTKGDKGTIREKGRATIKKKSIKSKALDINSKRRARKAGNIRKKGHEGHVIRYITRRRAMKKLQLTLKDFRRLCILKGIYPREPPGKQVNQTCYHVKDISYLAHEPLLQKFADIKAYLDKVAHLLNRKNVSDAQRKYDARPRYTLEHLIKERYPRFRDSLADMDDALCLIHLFANMRIVSSVNAERSENCLRLAREWQLYVVRSRALRKTFVSVKGIYYQAEVMGETITWIVPHKFSQNAPREVDFRVMGTFLEFYESLTSFVLFKLYHSLGLQYPPKLDKGLDAKGAHLSAMQPEEIGNDSDEDEDKDDVEMGDAEDAEQAESSAAHARKKQRLAEEDAELERELMKEIEEEEQKEEKLTRAERAKIEAQSKERIESLSQRMREIIEKDQEEEEKDQEETGRDTQDPDLEDEAFAGDETAQQIAEQEREIQARTNLLRGLVFWLSREVPFESLEFVIRAFGGEVLCADAGDKPTDSRITHFVTDRPKVQRANSHCEYVQPQWVFDSVNWKILMPVQKYAPDAALPPHLSPFVDNTMVGYKPEFADEIERLQAAAGVAADKLAPPKLLRDTYRPSLEEQDEAEFKDSDKPTEDEEEAFVEELQEELRNGERRKRKRATEDKKSAEPEESDEDSGAEDSQHEATDKAISSAAEAEEEASDDDEEEEEEEEEEAPVTKKAKKEKAVPKTKEEPTPKKAKIEKEEKPKTYIKAKKFAGARPGYFFRLGAEGMGYYLDVNANRKPTFRSGNVVSKRQQRIASKKEENARSQMLMSKKAKKLYGIMQHGIKEKQANAAELRRRRRQSK
mmetsp:Transcript_17248/g.33861  ORF Transcript_17248/g.33861 Transcript_17248/m.33861 type:complete len:807 (-) Transcript_17248:293-2713(-)